MPRKQSKVPAYCLHKASGQAVVRISGKDHYLGKHGSPDSFERYERAIDEWRAGQSASQPSAGYFSSGLAQTLTINGLLLRYLQFAETYYVDEAGQATPEFGHMKYALPPLRRLFGRTLVRDFGPRSLKAVRQFMVDEEHLSRGVVNRRIGRVRRVIRWAVSEELAPPSLYESGPAPGWLSGGTDIVGGNPAPTLRAAISARRSGSSASAVRNCGGMSSAGLRMHGGLPAHLKAALLGSSVSIPIADGVLCLGTGQGIYLCEHRHQGGRRKLVLTLWGK